MNSVLYSTVYWVSTTTDLVGIIMLDIIISDQKNNNNKSTTTTNPLVMIEYLEIAKPDLQIYMNHNL